MAAQENQRTSVLALYRYVSINHKLRSLKPHTFVIPVSVVRNQVVAYLHSLLWVSHKAAAMAKVLTGEGLGSSSHECW
jgi:hypothetical protein